MKLGKGKFALDERKIRKKTYNLKSLYKLYVNS